MRETSRRFGRLVGIGTLLLSSVDPALAGDASRRYDGREVLEERERPNPRDLEDLRDGTGARLAQENDPRLRVAAGIAWTPGLPGGGGGSGGPVPYSASHRVTTQLPCLNGETDCSAEALSDSGRFVAGHSKVGTGVRNECTHDERHAVAWELDDEAALVHVHELPFEVPAGGGDVAWAHDVNDLGEVVGHVFFRWTDETCNSRQTKPASWKRDPTGAWTRADLPDRFGRTSAGEALAINNRGWILGYTLLDLDADGVGENSEIVVWIPSPVEPSGYRVETLPGVIEDGWLAHPWHLVGLSDQGTAVGRASREEADGSVPYRAVAWDRDAFGRWQGTELGTLGGQSSEPWGMGPDASVVGEADTGIIERHRGGEVERTHAARWVRDRLSGTWLAPIDLGTIDGAYARGIASDGPRFIVADSTVSPNDTADKYAAIWLDEGPFERLDDRLLDGSWVLRRVIDVSESDWILAQHWRNSGDPTDEVIVVPVAP